MRRALEGTGVAAGVPSPLKGTLAFCRVVNRERSGRANWVRELRPLGCADPMAHLETLIADITDAELRAAIEQAVRQLKEHTDFGLVFEKHIPESVLMGATVTPHVGDHVGFRKDALEGNTRFEVVAIKGGTATITDQKGVEQKAPVKDLLVFKEFGQPIFPTLRSLGSAGGGKGDPHIAINGENYHVLQMLAFTHEGAFDCVYLDPPYNTGARDWKYNNAYVDTSDRYRHSLWLSMMDKRLRLARRLLKPNGVLIITIDQNELYHLGALLEDDELFGDAKRQLVSIMISPSGSSGEGLSRVEEYAIFCFLGDAEPVPTPDDMLIGDQDDDGLGATGESPLTWESLLRRGNRWYRAARVNLCYPVLLSDDETRIVGVGEPWHPPHDTAGVEDESARPLEVGGKKAAWPVRKDGRLGIWRVEGERLRWLAERGMAYVSNRDNARGTWALKYLMSGTVDAIEAGELEVTGKGPRGEVVARDTREGAKVAKTIWHRDRHVAGGIGGTQLLNALIGERDRFSYPKSIYAVRDCLQIAVGDREDALILDFFAGSGTTLHATCLLNAQDQGRRRCIVVTNNEVEEKTARALNKQGHYVRDKAFEARGIFEFVARPRLTAAVTGKRASDDKPIPGAYLGGRPIDEGFDERVEYFLLDYLDPDRIELGQEYESLRSIFWLVAGSHGHCPTGSFPNDEPVVVENEHRYAVLFDALHFPDFVAQLDAHPEVSHVVLVTDDTEAFAAMTGDLGAGYTTHMLPRDYLSRFRINVLV